jgi:hypothetical protein
MDQLIGLSVREALGILTLLFSLAGNGFQLYRQRLYIRTIYNWLVAAFNNIEWLLERCTIRSKELAERAGIAEKPGTGGAGDRVVLKEFRDFSVETEYMLRGLHEHLVAVAKTLRRRDKRWQAGEFGYKPGEVEKNAKGAR